MAVRVPPIPIRDMEGFPPVVQDWMRKLLLNFVTLYSQATPSTPPAGQFYIFMDEADSKLKAIGPSGTVTIIANP